MTPGLLGSEMFDFQALEHMMHVSRTWDSILSLVPKGGETIWGNSDWSPEEGFVCDPAATTKSEGNNTDAIKTFQLQETTKHGPIVSFQNKVSSYQLHPPHVKQIA